MLMQWDNRALVAACVMSALLPLVLLTGCDTPAREYIEADRATYQAVGTEYEAYVKADPELSEIEKDTRLHTTRSWDERIMAAEEALNDE